LVKIVTIVRVKQMGL